MEKFNCINCGSSQLKYQKWIKFEDKVIIHPSGHIEYYDQEVDDNDLFGVDCRYICGSCKKPLQLFNGFNIQTESQLQNYIEFYSEEIIYSQD